MGASPIRILVGMFGVDQHEVGALVISSALRDAGFEVIYVGRYQTPQTLLRTAQEEDVDAIGISCHSWEYGKYAPELVRLLAESELPVPVFLGGSVITELDAAEMRAAGVAQVFGASGNVDDIAIAIRQRIAGDRA